LKAKITIREVAQKAEVSIGTVSRVINGHSNVAQNISQRVEAAIIELGYEPNALAQSMRRGATRTIGVMIRDIALPTFPSFVSSAQETLLEAGYALMLMCSEDRPERELNLLNVCSQRRVDGLIMTTCSENNKELKKARVELGLPLIMLDRDVEEEGADSLLLAHAESMRTAVSYLIGLGHSRVGLVTGDKSVYPARDRILGYQQAYQNGGMDFDAELVRSQGFASDSAFLETSALLGSTAPPTAIIAGGIATLTGVLRAIQVRGLRIPEDISVIGGADSDLAQLVAPAITVIRWNYAELGRIGAQLLLDRIDSMEPPKPKRIIFPTEFIIRSSCASPSQ
jgi:LacI family transcriptional regulator, galactose operon repressor